MHLAPGSRVGPYEILGPLGAGGMGEVSRARDPRLGRDVAIKALPAGFARDPERLERFEREARILASLSHPNIATIFGLEAAAGSPCLVLELVEGESLAERLARGPLPVRDTLEVGGQIAAAVEAAHEQDVVHRDLKPGNVMLGPSRVVKVLDFGLARSGPAREAADGPTLVPPATAAGVVLGTSSYMSPEQTRGLAVDRRGDVWAFGCVLFECLAGRSAFGGGTLSDVIGRVLEREPEWNALPPEVPARLRDVLRRCLTKDAAHRPRDIGDLRRELESIAQDLSSGVRPVSAAPSLAVLYFENLASDAENEYFCAGITEDILTDLSKIQGLRVASRNAVARYRGAPADIAKVGADLGVDAVLEGSVRRSGERVRITAQLIQARDGFHLWAERYDRTLEDVFAVQEEIAAAIAQALRVALTPSEAETIGRDRPDDVRAYDLYLKGRALYGQYSPESMREALRLFQQAIAVDPNYARAWAGVADCHGQAMQWGVDAGKKEETERLGLEAARKAIELDPRLPDGYKAEALVLRFTGDREASLAALKRALEADPRFTPALLNLAVDTFGIADVAGAERLLRRTLGIDPQEAFATLWLSWLTACTLRLDESLGWARRLREFSTDSFYVTASYLFECKARLLRGEIGEAEALLGEGRAAGIESRNACAIEASLAVHGGRLDEAGRVVAEAEDMSVGLIALQMLAGTALRLGRTDAAVRFLQRPIARELAAVLVRLDPELHALAGHPPFEPRRMDRTLVWPLEAPMIDRARFRLFREVRIESGLPET